MQKHGTIHGSSEIIALDPIFKDNKLSNMPTNQLAVNEKSFSNSGVDYFGLILIKSSRRTRLNPASQKDTKYYLLVLQLGQCI